MTDQEIRIAVAEIAGWTNIRLESNGVFGQTDCAGVRSDGLLDFLPDYLTDANAAIALLEKWAEGYGVDYDAKHKTYAVTLCSFSVDATYADAPTFCRAACEAVLRAAGKWSNT